jgi:hypothetical protein
MGGEWPTVHSAALAGVILWTSAYDRLAEAASVHCGPAYSDDPSSLRSASMRLVAQLPAAVQGLQRASRIETLCPPMSEYPAPAAPSVRMHRMHRARGSAVYKGHRARRQGKRRHPHTAALPSRPILAASGALAFSDPNGSLGSTSAARNLCFPYRH